MRLRTVIAVAAFASVLAVAAPSAGASPSATVVDSATSTCVVSTMIGLRGPTKVRTTGSQLAEAFLDMTGCDSAFAIVERAATQQTPFTEHGFDCTPRMVSARVGQWACVFQAADTPSVIRLRFTARYAK